MCKCTIRRSNMMHNNVPIVHVKYNGDNINNYVGQSTLTNYGKKTNGSTFVIFKRDFIADPARFEEI